MTFNLWEKIGRIEAIAVTNAKRLNEIEKMIGEIQYRVGWVVAVTSLVSSMVGALIVNMILMHIRGG